MNEGFDPGDDTVVTTTENRQNVSDVEKRPHTPSFTVDGKPVDGVDIGDVVVDIHNRDPNDINSHLKIEFEEIFAESRLSTYSFDSVWSLSIKLFTCSKLWCYRITTCIFVLPLVILWGIYFACVAFCTTWCYQPCLKAYDLNLFCLKQLYKKLLEVFYGPCCEMTGRLFSNIKITTNTNQTN
ncbi:caveolin-3-like [Tubulanus polymorphus]|uniref:caveolin-3-like n=1 Tax=Tubulanus polymorphus TaxID=672921 RepID=UPI003DA60664